MVAGQLPPFLPATTGALAQAGRLPPPRQVDGADGLLQVTVQGRVGRDRLGTGPHDPMLDAVDEDVQVGAVADPAGVGAGGPPRQCVVAAPLDGGVYRRA